MHTKEQLKEQLAAITQQKQMYTQSYSELQSLTSNSKVAVYSLREKFQKCYHHLYEGLKKNCEQLDMIKYRCEKLSNNGEDVVYLRRNVDFQKEFYEELREKVRKEGRSAEERISERERWELTNEDHYSIDEESHLIMSTAAARDAKNNAAEVTGLLEQQGGRLGGAREKMGDVLRNINLSGNIVNLIKKRSKEDNKLIVVLSLGLLVELVLCLYVIRPWLRG